MNVIITGDVGIGKSTVCRKIVEMAKGDGLTCGGVLTSRQEENLWIENIRTGQAHLLASVSEEGGEIPIGRYFFRPEGIQFGRRAIRQALHVDLFTVDEMGPLELRGRGFSDVFDIIRKRQSKANLLVIRKILLEKFENLLNLTLHIFEVTLKSRKMCHEEIYSSFKESN